MTDSTVNVVADQVPGPGTPFVRADASGGTVLHDGRALASSTVYEVAGRGRFYTDAEGQVVRVETTSGGAGVGPDLSRPLPGTEYVVNGDTVFWTNDLGWISETAIRGTVTQGANGSEQFLAIHGADLRPVDGLPLTGGPGSMRGIDVARQGQVGDCGLVATLNSLGYRAPHVLESGVVADGSTVRVGGLTVTPDLPVGPDGSIGPVARSTDGSTWVSLTERAITEQRGGYDQWAEGGVWPRDVFEAVTGTPSRTIDPSGMDETTLAQQLAEQHRAMVASSRDIDPGTPADSLRRSYGLYGGHAYSVRAVDANGCVLLHNPWGFRHPSPVPMHVIKHLFVTLDIWP